ncbi:SPOR domain-containing protein [Pseudogemmatithrix spongiicola]|uniref:SPOR domain-containing protein n=1 Tax=Pseudogemmatithrix spongiicola TaxID=3062599 RepID=A0AA49K3C1_9BACT|nr:SPOR domain-containing protein [Gemmatimonadaceae bacterium 'strain 138']WKW16533.1 SPOR domain-containing protein [Gemmatimonadaceae bacterium 'strain 318']
MWRALWPGVVGLVLHAALSPLPVRAQGTPTVTRAEIYRRAQRLVNDGYGTEGRALVDSLLNATAPRSADEAEVLFWRATLAENWDQAQRDYMRVMLEHERSAFAPRAMLRLAQGELMRADTAAALRYLERSVLEAPEFTDAKTLRDRIVAARQAVQAPVAAPPAPSAAAGTMAWSVQIAAFPTAGEAAAFAAEMRARGYETRVDGTTAPFRVRFGYYASRGAAAAAMEAYKANARADAFLTQVPRP